MKIAILGWGSLIWDERPEFDIWREEWLPDGPSLKLEFSRVSESRLGALTLVIDEQHGEVCRVNYALSKRRDFNDAVCDLRCREGTALKRIGYYLSDSNRLCELPVPDAIKSWANEKKLDGVVWTGLSNNFREKVKAEFSVFNALEYIKTLPPEGKAKALEYIWRAPDFIHSPLRRSLEVEPMV